MSTCDKHDGIYDTIASALRIGGKAARAEADTYLRLIRSCGDCREFHDRARRIWAEETAAAIPNPMTPARVNARFKWWWDSKPSSQVDAYCYRCSEPGSRQGVYHWDEACPRRWEHKLAEWNTAVAAWR